MKIPEMEKVEVFSSRLEDMVSIEAALSQNTVFVDVRSPKEFNESPIVGAINLPLFTDAERAHIGTIYKQISQGAAFDLGKRLVDSRLAKFVKGFQPFKEKLITIYCARGGMRSAAVVRLLSSLGFRVQQLAGGYKSYRKHVLQALKVQCPSPLIVIHGQTGVGKTRLLKKLPLSIDLEDLAQHRSSVFGAVNRQPRTQKDFEAHLYTEMRRFPSNQTLFIEGESRKIGDVLIPDSLFRQMKQGTMVLLKASLETRVKRIIEDYAIDGDQAIHKLRSALNDLRVSLGHCKIDELCQCLDDRDYYTIVKTLLTEYYDPRYQHSMRNYTYALEESAENLELAAGRFLTFQQNFKHSPLP
ncbi:MAG: tRNA 2-selenouridine(34) synthase MnmH [SAR324 cluster bacterium]|nr:tRNA 2-selenouridine(34) synthase MnmH [SAR324 cluster bacterium]